MVMDTPDGRRKVKVVPRKFNTNKFRYYIGIAYQLFGTVDLWIIWCEQEQYAYALPDNVVKQIWIDSGRRTSQSDQFDFNFHVDTGLVEAPATSLTDYRIDLNAGAVEVLV